MKTLQIKGHVVRVLLVCAVLLSSVSGTRAEMVPAQYDPLLRELAGWSSSPLEELVSRSSPLEVTQGFASYYARRLDGRKTTSGHRYQPDRMTAAHASLPLGTVVRVINPVTSQEVQVTVNDRCSQKSYSFIDLSRAAAKRIGLYGKGKMRVVIIPLLEEPLEDPA